jgi:hypothetical protein
MISSIENKSEYFAALEINKSKNLNSRGTKVINLRPYSIAQTNIKFILDSDEKASIKVFSNDNVYILPLVNGFYSLPREIKITQNEDRKPIFKHALKKQSEFQEKSPWATMKAQVCNPALYKFKNELEEEFSQLHTKTTSPNNENKKNQARTIALNDKEFDTEFIQVDSSIILAQSNLEKMQIEATFGWDQKFLHDIFKF